MNLSKSLDSLISYICNIEIVDFINNFSNKNRNTKDHHSLKSQEGLELKSYQNYVLKCEFYKTMYFYVLFNWEKEKGWELKRGKKEKKRSEQGQLGD